ncbi:MAG TPA: NAD(P)/FAD-dependent oxidoreductase [Sphingorhabdus sp.]|nr:NAD(P)/FAD-dependent oxidoreductase [Sphingorhabdus sp.]
MIVGAGFGGLAAAKGLRHADVDVTIVDQRNHHIFQPLLYQVATAGLSPADIAAPIRSILRKNINCRVMLDRVVGVDAHRNRIMFEGSDPLEYDWLILATGARHSYFGRDEWAEHAPGIKSIEDATSVRHRILLAMERAENETDKARRDALLTFVVIGGGPTGVEMAGAIAELARQSVSNEFRSITPHCSRVMLIEAGPRILPGFPPSLSARAASAIGQLGVEVRTGAIVEDVLENGVRVGEDIISARTVVWAAGVKASPAAEWLGTKGDRAGRVPVGPDLHPEGESRIFVIGDTAACQGAGGTPLPGIAPVAKQQGEHCAKAIVAMLGGRKPAAFRYRNYGNLATIGRKRAVADFGRLRFHGFAAWVVWCVAHIWFLAGFRNRLLVGANWLWNYLTFERHARLITGEASSN